MSYNHNKRTKAVKTYLKNKALGNDYIIVNGKKCRYINVFGQWKLLKLDD